MTPTPISRPRDTAEEAARWWLMIGSDDGLPDSEEAAFEAWLAEDAAHGEALRRCSELWTALDGVGSAPEIVSRRADALEDMRRANQRRWSRPFRMPKFAYAVAASLLAIVGVGGWHLAHDDRQRLTTQVGERRTLLLADGSRVLLDARSRLSVAIEDKQRRLQIDAGRAKFDVAYEPKRPFTVEAAGHVVIATGTSFSTELVGGELHVIVYEGEVVVLDGSMPDRDTLLTLRHDPRGRATAIVPGQEYVARGAAAIVRRDAEGSLSWEAGQLEFVDEPLSDVIERLNRYSTTEMAITDQRAAKVRVNGIFKAGNSAAFLDAIRHFYPVVVRQTGPDRVEISSSA